MDALERQHMNKIRLAFLGVGDVAQRDYFPELYRLQNQIELVAVCGKSERRARHVAEQYHARTWYTDAAQMYAECEIDAVANLTPIQAHFETTLAALRAGKHVYSEKPLASRVADARELARTSQQRKRKLICAPCVMLFPQVRYAQQLVEENTVGEIFSARAYGHGGTPPWLGYSSDPSPYFGNGAGPALDMGVYPLHALTGLLGPVRRVSAMTSRTQESFVVADGPAQGKRVPIEVDDNWHMLLDFGNGQLASIQANNCVQDSLAPQLEMFGLNGTLALNLLDVGVPVHMFHVGGEWESISLPQTGRAAGPDHLLGIEHLVECIQNDTAPVLSAAHAIHVLEIIEQAARSATEGRTIDVTSTF
jgi:predicted dehydrogenase